MRQKSYTMECMLFDPYKFRPATIIEIVREAPRAVSVRLATTEKYDFVCGQHAIIRVPMPDGSKLVRQYSFSSAPKSGELWLTIVQEPGGQVSGWFVETAKVDDSVEISPPFTGPLMQEIPRGEICMIAGGSGIAPLMAWVQTLRAQHRLFTLFYSTRTNERCFEQALTPLPGETISIRLTDTQPRFTEQEITSALSKNPSVFICGSRSFVLALRSTCEKVVSSEQIYNEAFTL